MQMCRSAYESIHYHATVVTWQKIYDYGFDFFHKVIHYSIIKIMGLLM